MAVFTIGVVAACLRLPEWRNRRVPAQSFFAARLQQIAGPAGLELESAPRMQLRSKDMERQTKIYLTELRKKTLVDIRY